MTKCVTAAHCPDFVGVAEFQLSGFGGGSGGGSGAADQVVWQTAADGDEMDDSSDEEVNEHQWVLRNLSTIYDSNVRTGTQPAERYDQLLIRIGVGPRAGPLAPFEEGLHLDGGAFNSWHEADYGPLLAPRSAYFTSTTTEGFIVTWHLNIVIVDVDRCAQIPLGSKFSKTSKGGFMVDRAPVELGAGVAPPGYEKERTHRRGTRGSYDDLYINKDGSTVRSCSEAWRAWREQNAPHCTLQVSCARDAMTEDGEPVKLYQGQSIVARFTKWEHVPRDYYDWTLDETYIFKPRFAGRED